MRRMPMKISKVKGLTQKFVPLTFEITLETEEDVCELARMAYEEMAEDLGGGQLCDILAKSYPDIYRETTGDDDV
jgi:hypothetical protein